MLYQLSYFRLRIINIACFFGLGNICDLYKIKKPRKWALELDFTPSIRITHHRFDGVGRWNHRLIAVTVYDADKTKRLHIVGVELMECLWAYKNDIILPKSMHFVAKYYRARPADDDHRMRVPMLLQRGVAAWFNLEIAGLHVEFPFIVSFAEQAISTHSLEISGVCLVLLAFNTFPMEVGAVNNF